MALGGTTAVEEELSEEISTAIAAAEAAVTDNASEAVLRANRAELKGAAITMVTAVRQETRSLFFFVSLSLSLSLLSIWLALSLCPMCARSSPLSFSPSLLPLSLLPLSAVCSLFCSLFYLSPSLLSLAHPPPLSLLPFPSLGRRTQRPAHIRPCSHRTARERNDGVGAQARCGDGGAARRCASQCAAAAGRNSWHGREEERMIRAREPDVLSKYTAIAQTRSISFSNYTRQH